MPDRTPSLAEVPRPFQAPARVLLGPGPSDVDPAVLTALSQGTIGHLDPTFLEVMDQVREMLRAIFGTENRLTLPMSGTGSAGMEACFVNLLRPGDRALIGVNGVFGGRMAEVARRAGAEVLAVDFPWGRAVDADVLREAARADGGGFDVIALVHAETSTGVAQDLRPFRALADEVGALFIADTVTSLGGQSVGLDEHGVDAAYSGTQKCLSCPPGLSPVSLSERAAARALDPRRGPSPSWYLDLALIGRYWGSERAYHHTAPTNMVVALHEALRLCLVEGLEARYRRHRRAGGALQAGLEDMGLELLVERGIRLSQLTAVAAPAGIDEAAVRRRLLADYGIEIGGGLGELKGEAWRIGLMGSGATRRNVMLCLEALRESLTKEGHRPDGDGLRAASAAWDELAGEQEDL